MNAQSIHLENIKYLAHRKRLSLNDLADKIGMTYVGLSKIIRENTTTMSTLLRIATVLQVPMQLFFMDPEDLKTISDFSVDNYSAMKLKNEALEKEVGELKDKIIRLLDKL